MNRSRADFGLVLIALAAFVYLARHTGRVSEWFVMTDELQNAKLAVGIATTFSPIPHIHGEYFGALSVLYPLVTAPLYGLFAMPEAFRAVHLLNRSHGECGGPRLPAHSRDRALPRRGPAGGGSHGVGAVGGHGADAYDRVGRLPGLPLGAARVSSRHCGAEPPARRRGARGARPGLLSAHPVHRARGGPAGDGAGARGGLCGAARSGRLGRAQVARLARGLARAAPRRKGACAAAHGFRRGRGDRPRARRNRLARVRPRKLRGDRQGGLASCPTASIARW